MLIVLIALFVVALAAEMLKEYYFQETNEKPDHTT